MSRPTLAEAKRKYPNRYTMESVPSWARNRPCDHGGTGKRFYAPQFRTDQDWYDHTIFPGEPEHHPLGNVECCYTTGETWPCGLWLDEPYRAGDPPLTKTSPVDVTFEVGGHGHGQTFSSLDEAASEIRDWILGIAEPDSALDYTIRLTLADAGAS